MPSVPHLSNEGRCGPLHNPSPSSKRMRRDTTGLLPCRNSLDHVLEMSSLASTLRLSNGRAGPPQRTPDEQSTPGPTCRRRSDSLRRRRTRFQVDRRGPSQSTAAGSISPAMPPRKQVSPTARRRRPVPMCVATRRRCMRQGEFRRGVLSGLGRVCFRNENSIQKPRLEEAAARM